jgi:hypothetical protein
MLLTSAVPANQQETKRKNQPISRKKKCLQCGILNLARTVLHYLLSTFMMEVANLNVFTLSAKEI